MDKTINSGLVFYKGSSGWTVYRESWNGDYETLHNPQNFIRNATPEENVRLNISWDYYMKGNIFFGSQVPHIGYYVVTEIFVEIFHAYGGKALEVFGKVFYCEESPNGPFLDIDKSIRLQTLFNYHSEYINKSFYKKNPKSLISKIIYVKSVDLIRTTFKKNGIEQKYQTYKVIWSVLNDQNNTKNYFDTEPKPVDNKDFDEIDPENIEPENEFDPEDLMPEDDYCSEDFSDEEEFYPED